MKMPRRQIKALEKSYHTRYHASLMENGESVKKDGITFFWNSREKNIYVRNAEAL